MFRKRQGFEAEYRGFSMVVTASFDEWRIMLKDADVVINGARQFSEQKAKEHAIYVADYYRREVQGEEDVDAQEIVWEELPKGKWLDWRQ